MKQKSMTIFVASLLLITILSGCNLSGKQEATAESASYTQLVDAENSSSGNSDCCSALIEAMEAESK